MWSLESMKVGGRGQSGKTLEANLSASFSRTIFLVPENPRSNLSSPCFVLLFLYFLISVCSPSGVRPLRTEKERNEIIFFQRALPWETGGGGGGRGGQGFTVVMPGLITGSWGNLPTLSQPHPRLGVTLLTPPRPLMGSGLGLDDSLSALKEDSLPCRGRVWLPGTTEG